MNSNWSYSPETKIWVVTSVTLTFDLWPWPFAWILPWSNVITPENFMMIRWWEHSQKGVTDGQTDRQTDRRTDRRTENTIHRAAWLQLKRCDRRTDGQTDRQTDRRTDGQTDGQTDRRTENTIHRAAWSQLKTIGQLFYATSSFVLHFVAIGEFKLELQSGNTQSRSNLTIFRAMWPWNLTDDLEKQ